MIGMDSSILDTVKKAIGVDPEETHFDPDIVMHINAMFAVLNQIGCGPEEGFIIEDSSSTWNDYIENNKLLNLVPSYMSLQVKLLFDPPSSSFVFESYRKTIDMLESRINYVVDHPEPIPPVDTEGDENSK